MYKVPNQINCPTCRQITHKKVDELPKNRLIVQFLELNSPPKIPISNVNPHGSPTHSTQKSNVKAWSEIEMYKKMFTDIDHNSDGRINFRELHEALIRGNPNSEFDQKTVRILLNKFDKDHDNEINFDEFHNLFVEINNQYNEFLDYDKDFSGSIDSSELTSLLSNKGYDLNRHFIDSLMNEVSKHTGKRNSVSFDLYARIVARIDHLRNVFNQTRLNSRINFQIFLTENFFLEF